MRRGNRGKSDKSKAIQTVATYTCLQTLLMYKQIMFQWAHHSSSSRPYTLLMKLDKDSSAYSSSAGRSSRLDVSTTVF